MPDGDSFKDQTWENRYSKMGDLAEQVFEELTQREGVPNAVRWGLNRPPLQVGKLPKRIRYAPDYLQTNHFTEVQGFGQDQTIKLKLDKYDALRWWNVVHPVMLFLFDSANTRNVFVSLDDVTAILESGDIPIRKFPEGHAYYAFGAEFFFDADAT